MQPPEERVIRFNALKLLLLFVPLAVLVALSMWLDFDSWRNGDLWMFLVFGGVALILLVGIVVGPRRCYLRLTPESLTVSHLIGSRTYRWPEVRNFRLVHKTINATPAGNLVVFDLAEESPHLTAGKRLASKINGYHVSIMAMFHLDAEELANLLNEWQHRYGMASG